jgi:glucan phosphoethanolaminetransferase (alkaline phosphatase superfamily)
MRATYRVLALLIAVGVVLQAAFVATAWFQVLHDTDSGAVFDKNSEPNWAYAAHGLLGIMIIPLIAIVLLILSFFARIPGGVKWAAITFGVVLLQVVLAFAGWAAPVVGALHGINAFALAGVASVAARKARAAETTSVEPAAPVGSA